MAKKEPTKTEIKLIDSLVAYYEDEQNNHLVKTFLSSLLGALEAPNLSPFIHSVKGRLKDPKHLKDKLLRKLEKSKEIGAAFDYTAADLFEKVNDLAGVRLLHLHTRQFASIDPILRQILEDQQYTLLEPPFARTWDDESREFFQGCGIECQISPDMYTSVHYVVSSASKKTVTAEIQVRTLSEELWGEVDHTLNYPHKVDSLACREQLRVLARLTSSATRLVDSIFRSYEEFKGGS